MLSASFSVQLKLFKAPLEILEGFGNISSWYKLPKELYMTWKDKSEQGILAFALCYGLDEIVASVLKSCKDSFYTVNLKGENPFLIALRVNFNGTVAYTKHRHLVREST